MGTGTSCATRLIRSPHNILRKGPILRHYPFDLRSDGTWSIEAQRVSKFLKLTAELRPFGLGSVDALDLVKTRREYFLVRIKKLFLEFLAFPQANESNLDRVF